MSPHGLPSYSMFRKGDGVSYETLIEEFEAELKRQEEILYGISLFYEGVFLLLARQQDVVETNRKQYRNIIRSGNRIIDWGRTLLEDARKDPTKAPLLHSFNFTSGSGHPEPHKLEERALLLLATHVELFPDRPLGQPLNQEETLALFEKASVRLDDVQAAPPPSSA